MPKQHRKKPRNHASRRMLAKTIEHQRSAVVEVDADMQYRAAAVGDVNEESRTIVATISTEQPVPMYDYRSGRMIDEVLVARGGNFPNQVPLLDDHSRWGSSSVLGSGRNIALSGDRWKATLHFARNAGERVENIWQLVSQRHLTDVSIGYRYDPEAYVDIPPGKTQEVAGRTYTAGPTRTLRVVTKWSGREVSTTPIGADDQAKIGRSRLQRGIGSEATLNLSSEFQDSASRSIRAEDTMDPILDFLRKHGLAANVTDQAAALTFARTLSVQLQTEFAEVCRSNDIDFVVQPPAATPPADQARSQQPQQPAAAAPAATAAPTQTAEQIRAERERVMYVYQQRGNLPEELVSRAITENWDTNRVNTEFAAARSANPRTPPVNAQAPAGHVVDRSIDLRTLQAAMLMRSGINPESQFLRSQEAQIGLTADRSAQAGWITENARHLSERGDLADDSAKRAFEKAWGMRSISMIDICRCALDIEGVRYDRFDQHDILQRSFSTGTLNAVFTTNFNAQLLEGFVGIDDTTRGWTAESEVGNFQTVERITAHKFSRLKKVERNSQVGDADVQAVYESYKLARYAERFTVDEMDIIDDRFGMLNMAPQDMGEAAGELRPDLVYSILLSNPTMSQDSKALFHTDHSNYTSSGAGLSSSTLASRRSTMLTQTSNGRLCNIQPRHLIVPTTKEHTALVLVGSAERRDTTSNTEYGTKNWAQGRFNVVPEPRLDAGLVDPSDDSSVAGQAGSWFLAADRGKYGIEVGYLRGTGGVPVVRRYQLNDGLLGVGWMVIMYIGAKAVGYQGLACSKE